MSSFPQGMPQPGAPVVDVATGAFTVTGYRFFLNLWSRTGGAQGASVADCLKSADNLSDVANTSTARANLGLGSAAVHPSTDFATAAQGALASTALQPATTINVAAVDVGGAQVVGARQTGWSAPTGTVSRAAFDQSTVTLPQLAQRLAALIDDLTAHGLIGT